MKIVYVSDAVHPYHLGGKEKRLYELSTRLARLGHDVHIYTMHWWLGSETSRIEDGVTLHAISPLYQLYQGDRRSIKQGVLFGVSCLKLLAVPFDVLDVDHMPFFPVFSAWLVCLLKRRRLHGTWHEALASSEWVSYMGKAGYIAAVIEHLSIKLPYRITAASEQTKLLLARYHGRTKRVDVVASGVDLAAIARIEPAQARCDVLYVGRLVKDKNVDVLVKAIDMVAKTKPDIRCTIIGSGIELGNLQQLVARLKLERHVTIAGPLPRAEDIYARMKSAKVFALPSVREGFGIVALEALSCGTPVITTNAAANAAKHLITDGKDGSIVPPAPQPLADAIMRWISLSKRPNFPELHATYDWNALASKQAKLYEIDAPHQAVVTAPIA